MRFLLPLVLLAAFAAGTPAWAQPLCNRTDTAASPPKEPHLWDGGKLPYRVNRKISLGVTADEERFAVARAAGIWNEQANAEWLQYKGTTSRTSLPAVKADCDTANIDYNLVLLGNVAGGSRVGRHNPKCVDSNGVARHWEVIVDSSNAGGTINWGVGNIGATEWPLVANLLHEMGHALGVYHPNSGVMGVTQVFATTSPQGERRWHDLYEYDMYCAATLVGVRSAKGHLAWAINGSIGSSFQWTPSAWDSWKGTLGRSWVSGAFSAVHGTGGDLSWTPNVASSPTANALSGAYGPEYGVTPLAAAWRESPSWDRVFFIDYAESPTNSETATHQVRTQKSSLYFGPYGVQHGHVLRECAWMTGWMTCTFATAIKSGKTLAVAWDNYVNASHTVYVNQNRGDDAATREVRISTGFVPGSGYEDILPQHNSLGVDSVVTPGIACEAHAAGGYDCIVAYVPEVSPTSGESRGEIFVKRFWTTTGSTRYGLNIESTPHQVGTTSSQRTGEALAAWRLLLVGVQASNSSRQPCAGLQIK